MDNYEKMNEDYNDFIYELATDSKKREQLSNNPKNYLNKYYDDKLDNSINVVAHKNSKDVFYFVIPYIPSDVDLSSIQVAAFGDGIEHVSSLASIGSFGSVSTLGTAATTIGSASTAGTVSTAGTAR